MQETTFNSISKHNFQQRKTIAHVENVYPAALLATTTKPTTTERPATMAITRPPSCGESSWELIKQGQAPAKDNRTCQITMGGKLFSFLLVCEIQGVVS